MAKVFGPCMSISAAGSIKKTITFQKRPSGISVIKPPVPSRAKTLNPTAAQAAHRTVISNLVSAWQALNDNQRGYWDNVAKELGNNLAGYHEFMKAGGVATMPLLRLIDYYSDLKNCLVGYWPFDDAGADAAKDYSGEGNDGTLKPSYPANCPSQVGSKNMVLDKALSFDGVDDYVDAGNAASLNQNLLFSVSFFMKIAVDNKYVMGKITETSAGKGWSIYNSGMAFLIQQNGTNYKLLAFGTSIIDGFWHHMVYVSNNGILTAFMDGKPLSGTPAGAGTVTDITNTDSFLIGINSNKTALYFSGPIDEVRIYNRALSASEIKQLYDLGTV